MTDPLKIHLTDELFEWYEVLKEAREQKKEWTEREEEAKAHLTRLLGARDAEVLNRDGNPMLVAVNRPGSRRLDVKKLQKELPDIAARYTSTTAGSYRLELVTDDVPE